jgi:mono/diheme cytochrome c family protein
MRFRRSPRPNIPLLVLTFLLGVSTAARVLADYDMADEQSLANGAQLYEVFCGDCHGIRAAIGYGQLYATDDPGAVDDEYDKLIEIVEQEETAQLIVVPEEEFEWPEWAERPDPNAEQPLDEKTELMNTLTAVIDDVHGIKGSATPQNSGSNSADSFGELLDEQPAEAGPPGGFEPLPGVTNLADPSSYFYGTSEEEVFESIAEGTGEAMPGFRTELGGDEAVMDVVNYIRSFWGEEWLY